MKVYIKSKDNIASLQAYSLLEKQLLSKGHEVVKSQSDSDLIFTELNDKFNYSRYLNAISKELRSRTKCYYLDGNSIKFIDVNNSSSLLTAKVGKDKENVVSDFDKNKIKKLQKDVVDFILNKKSTIETIEPMPLMVFKPIVDLFLNKNRENEKFKTLFNNVKTCFELSDDDVVALCDEVASVIRFKDCRTLELARKVKAYYVSGMPVAKECTEVVIPNVSDSVLQNMIKAMMKLDFFMIAKDEEKKKSFFAQYKELINTVAKTVRNSLVSKNAWGQYSAPKQELVGLYALYGVNNLLGNNEVMIPHPKNAGIKINKLNKIVNGKKHEVVIYHNNKEINIVGEDASELRSEFMEKFPEYDIYLNRSDMKAYPSIGDEVILTRHPITTLVIKAKVVGYTEDATIQFNSLVALCLYGDADGDSSVISWNKQILKANFGTAKDVEKFADVAGIKMDTSEFHNNYELKQFAELKPFSKEECLIKSAKTGLEQAKAKKMTAEVTGIFGAKERDIVQSLILNGAKLNIEIMHQKSWMSQMLVQAKNILKDIQSGKELPDLIKNTILVFALMSGSDVKAAKSLAVLLELSPKEVLNLLNEWRGDNEVIEVVEELPQDNSINMLEW